MELSIIGFSQRVKKYYLNDKNLNIHKILRINEIDNILFTIKLRTY